MILAIAQLGKGLERLVARRLAHAATQAGLVSKQYAGALPGTSVTDLVQALGHNLELARSRGQHTAICLLDVKGGFNNI